MLFDGLIGPKKSSMINLYRLKIVFFVILILLFFFNIFSMMGRGIIKASSKRVWETVRNPMSRLIYDKMIKVYR